MTTTTLITTLALALAAAPGIRAQAPMTPVIDPTFRQMLEQMPPTQTLDVYIKPTNSPAPPNLSGAEAPAEVKMIVEQKIAEGQLLEKPVIDAIAAHGGIILTAYYDIGDIRAALSAQSVLDLANDPDILRMSQMQPHSVLSSSFRQMLEQMPPTQLIDYVSVQTYRDPLLEPTLGTSRTYDQLVAEFQVIEKPMMDAILAHGGVITYTDYDVGGFLATLSVQAILDLANDYDIRQIGILSPGGYPAQPPTGQGSAPVPGDVNSDGVVDIRDARLALQALVGAAVLTPQQQLAASCRLSQWPSIACVTAILRLAIGLPSG